MTPWETCSSPSGRCPPRPLRRPEEGRTMLTTLDEYVDKYDCVQMEADDGILLVTLYTDAGPILSSPHVHQEIPRVFADISNDLDNLCVIITGTGDAFWPG